MTPILLPLTRAEYAEIRRWLGCPGHDGKRVLGEGLTGEGMIALRRKVEALEHGGLEVPKSYTCTSGLPDGRCGCYACHGG